MRTRGKTIVLSDLHFGVAECSIGTWSEDHLLPKEKKKKNKKNLERLFDYFGDVKNLQHIILLGDVFDLHLSNLTSAIKASMSFFQKLQDIPTLREIEYIPGNHDHLLWSLHVFGNLLLMN